VEAELSDLALLDSLFDLLNLHLAEPLDFEECFTSRGMDGLRQYRTSG